jgi:hypothetical protein
MWFVTKMDEYIVSGGDGAVGMHTAGEVVVEE